MQDIWMEQVKARLVGNEESKKMKKTMLKQQFAEFSVTEEEGLHKGYDRFQKILSQLNQVQARPDNDDINLKFLRALPSSWSQVALALKTRGGLESMSFDDLLPDYSAFIGTACSGSKPTYSDHIAVKTDEPKALSPLIPWCNWSIRCSRKHDWCKLRSHMDESWISELSMLKLPSECCCCEFAYEGISPKPIPSDIEETQDDGELLLRPQQVTLGGIHDHNFGGPRVMGDPSTDNDIGIVDSGCSRSMTGNKEKLDDFVQIKGGIVKFGGGDGRISGKGTIRTSKLDFENVYYVEELQHFNLFSVSQICDKKNKVLFTDTDCLVLSEEFQLPDESQV
ncbi:hypothetical protein Tco_0556866, partial [Tanacetum coccineum]